MESFLTHASYSALIVLAFLEASCVVFISAEITFGFAGVLAWQGHLNLLLVIIIGAAAELAGSYFSYWLGRRGGRPMVERLGGRLTITSRDIDRLERFFDGRGSWSVGVARLIPVVRSITGLASGFLEVPAVPFGLYNLAATLLWATGFSLLGYSLGGEWTTLSKKITDGGYVLLGLVVLGAVFVVVHRLRHVRKERAKDAAAAANGHVPDSSHASQPAPAAAQAGDDMAAESTGRDGGEGPASTTERPHSHRRR